MGDKIEYPKKVSAEITKGESLRRNYNKRSRNLRISRTRGGLVRNQILRAYEILENIRFDHISDTAFREKIVRAKQSLESAIGDFLLDDNYWNRKIKKHREMTPEKYDAYLKKPVTQGDQGSKQGQV